MWVCQVLWTLGLSVFPKPAMGTGACCRQAKSSSGIPVVVDNDVRMATLGNGAMGPEGVQRLHRVVCGVAVGCGLVLNSTLHYGAPVVRGRLDIPSLSPTDPIAAADATGA